VLDCAIRELIEETGYRASEWARAGLLNNAIAYSNEAIEVWFARGLVAGERQLDAGEFLDLCSASVEELEALAHRGELTDAKTLIGLLWLQNWRAGRWAIEWRPAP
jgi:ADP-ribose pyrophosphatase